MAKGKLLSSHIRYQEKMAEDKSKLSLLEQAKQLNRTRDITPFSDEELELVQAWLDDEVALKQIDTVLKGTRRGSTAYTFLATGVRELYRRSKQTKV